MANIDVSEVLQDPDFQDNFLVQRSSESVDNHGRAQLSTTTSWAYGVVQPASGRAMDLVPDAFRTREMLEIWTQFGIQEANDARAADEVIWNNKHYIVVALDDFDNWGQGYVHATLSRKELLSAATPL